MNQACENTCINLLGVVGMTCFLEANPEVSIAWVPLVKKPIGFLFLFFLNWTCVALARFVRQDNPHRRTPLLWFLNGITGSKKLT